MTKIEKQNIFEWNGSGLIRNLGSARIYYEKVSKKKKSIESDIYNWFQKIDPNVFSKDILHKSIRLIPKSEKIDEPVLWLVLFLVRSYEEGEICIPKETMYRWIAEKAPLSEPAKSIEEFLKNNKVGFLTDEVPFLEDMDSFYLVHLQKAEKELSENMFSLLHSFQISQSKELENSSLSEEQKSVIGNSLKNTISFISGGPGTGKTTIIISIVRESILRGIDISKIALTAPTGKATKRLRESANKLYKDYPSLQSPITIHKLLSYSNSRKTFLKNESNPLNLELLIVDESSMIDIFISNALLKALPKSEDLRVVFLGDPDQLMSVGAGNIFSELVQIKDFSFKLTKSFRITSQKEDITKLKEAIKENKDFDLNPYLVQTVEKSLREFSFVEVLEPKENLYIELSLWRELAKNMKETYQILTPFNEGKGGVSEINEYLHKKYTENIDSIDSSTPVIVKRNLYDYDLFNGETGYLKNVNGKNIFLNSDSKVEIEISHGLLSYLEKAYSITVHKSQGSEYDHVCLVLPNREDFKNSILTKRILYTAITRCKKTLTIIGSVSTFDSAIKNPGNRGSSNFLKRIENLKIP